MRPTGADFQATGGDYFKIDNMQIATRKDVKTTHTLIRAIEDEHDGDVQLAMIAALGRIATPDAVQKLVKMAEPEGRRYQRRRRPAAAPLTIYSGGPDRW